MLAGSPAAIAWPHGEAIAAAVAPGNVLSVGGLDVVGAQVVRVEQLRPSRRGETLLRAPRLDRGRAL